MVTSSGMAPCSMISRTNRKSVSDADGKPTSISVKPISTSLVNIFHLRSGSIGSMSAWLPSRRSTEHHSGASVMTFDGHVRSGRSIGAKARYFPVGMPLGRCAAAIGAAVGWDGVELDVLIGVPLDSGNDSGWGRRTGASR